MNAVFFGLAGLLALAFALLASPASGFGLALTGEGLALLALAYYLARKPAKRPAGRPGGRAARRPGA